MSNKLYCHLDKLRSINNNQIEYANHMNNFFKLTLAFAITALINTSNAFALTSSGTDGALVLNSVLNINASNNQVFNYTLVDLQAGSTLKFSGLNSGDTVFILGTSDITLGGIINLPSNTSFTFETSGNIHFGGSLLTSNSNVSFISNSFQTSSNSLISDIGGSVSIAANSFIDINGTINVLTDPTQNLGNGGDINIRNLPPLTPIPEPSSYLLLTLGLLALTFRLKRFNEK